MQLLEIEKELGGPDADAALARYDGTLVALDSRLRAALAAGLEPEAYGAAEELRAAVETARKILRLTVRGKR